MVLRQVGERGDARSATPSRRPSSSACELASIATWVTPAARISASVACSSSGVGVVNGAGALDCRRSDRSPCRSRPARRRPRAPAPRRGTCVVVLPLVPVTRDQRQRVGRPPAAVGRDARQRPRVERTRTRVPANLAPTSSSTTAATAPRAAAPREVSRARRRSARAWPRTDRPRRPRANRRAPRRSRRSSAALPTTSTPASSSTPSHVAAPRRNAAGRRKAVVPREPESRRPRPTASWRTRTTSPRRCKRHPADRAAPQPRPDPATARSPARCRQPPAARPPAAPPAAPRPCVMPAKSGTSRRAARVAVVGHHRLRLVAGVVGLVDGRRAPRTLAGLGLSGVGHDASARSAARPASAAHRPSRPARSARPRRSRGATRTARRSSRTAPARGSSSGAKPTNDAAQLSGE